MRLDIQILRPMITRDIYLSDPFRVHWSMGRNQDQVHHPVSPFDFHITSHGCQGDGRLTKSNHQLRHVGLIPTPILTASSTSNLFIIKLCQAGQYRTGHPKSITIHHIHHSPTNKKTRVDPKILPRGLAPAGLPGTSTAAGPAPPGSPSRRRSRPRFEQPKIIGNSSRIVSIHREL